MKQTQEMLQGVLLVLIYCHVTESQPRECVYRCRDLTAEEFNEKGIRYIDGEWVLNQEIVERSGIGFLQLDEIEDKYLEIHRHTDDNQNVTCLTIQQQIASGQHNIHLCPSYRVENYDKNRIPNSVHERLCRCSNCQTRSAAGSACRPLFRNRQVLRRTGCRRGVYQYAFVMEGFSHGCVCQRNSLFINPQMEA